MITNAHLRNVLSDNVKELYKAEFEFNRVYDDLVKHLEERIRDDVDLTIQMAVDEIEDAYDIAKAPASYVRFHNR